MKTAKFIRAHVDKAALASLAASLSDNEYSHSLARGYASIDHEDSSIGGDFIERVSAKKQLTDPLGKKYSTSHVEFRVNSFILSSQHGDIEIRGDLRQVPALLTSLHEGSGFKASFETTSIDVGDWIDGLEGLGGLRIVQAVASGIEFDTSTSGVLSLTVGAEGDNAINRCREVLSKREHTIARAKIKFNYKNKEEQIVLYENGTIKSLKSDLDDIPVNTFRRSLRGMRNKKK